MSESDQRLDEAAVDPVDPAAAAEESESVAETAESVAETAEDLSQVVAAAAEESLTAFGAALAAALTEEEEAAAEEPEAPEAEEAAATKPEPEAEAEAETETEPAPEGEAGEAAAAELEAESETEPAPEGEAGEAEAEAEPEPEAEAEAEAEPEPEAEAEPEPEAVVAPPSSPYDLPGSWYVIHSYSGYENKVKANLGTRIKSMHMEEAIFDVVIPMEDVVEIKAGRKVTVPKKQFPGYLLVRMYLDDESWQAVRNTPGVTGFVGSASKPTPLSRREVERILGVRKDEEEKKAPRFKPEWEVGETVRVLDGPFADFNGVIEDINIDQSKVRVLVDIFGRETPVELNFEQIQKF